VKPIEAERIARGKQEIDHRLYGAYVGGDGPVIRGGNIHYQVSQKQRGIAHGGVGLLMQLVGEIGLREKIDERLCLLKQYRPYTESDHVLNFVLNAWCDGTTLDDMELRRQDAAFLDAVGAARLPDPTTAGDFCRRFDDEAVLDLMDAIDAMRREVWRRQPATFFEEALVDVDGSLVPTFGECKEGIGLSYKGDWGYHPLVITLANTGEVLRLVNRPGNRPSHEGADVYLDDAIELLRGAGFRNLLLRGDTDFSQCHKLDEWDAQPGLRFLFGFDAVEKLKDLADAVPAAAWRPLRRPGRSPAAPPRQRPDNVKQHLVIEREYENRRLCDEAVAEFQYRPGKCHKSYRMIVVRKRLAVEYGGQLFEHLYRDFFYITNDRTTPADQMVFRANDRCQQENLIEQLKNGVRALSAPVNTEIANWAYMVMTALAWNLKAWWALLLPVTGPPKQRVRQQAEKQRVLRLEFKRFAQAFIRIPCLIVRSGRRLLYRILAWNPHLPTFYRLARVLRH
jgi:Transposase DDE domain group 1